MSSPVIVEARFYPPPERLRGYFTSFYATQIDCGDGPWICDALQPEWANLRFFDGDLPEVWNGTATPISDARFVVSGPSTRSFQFRLGRTRLWGIGLLPLGWARFVGHQASDYANLIANGLDHPGYATFAPLAQTLFGQEPDEQAELARLIDFFDRHPSRDPADALRIVAIHDALVDPRVASVSQLVARTGDSQRTVERCCDRHFGFSPKLLLRRQRFMRSLGQFMLDPSLKWIGALDWQYHDQAQFVRDFREFMGTSPSAYAAAPHPVLERFVIERARAHGTPMQTLDPPGGSSPASPARAA